MKCGKVRGMSPSLACSRDRITQGGRLAVFIISTGMVAVLFTWQGQAEDKACGPAGNTVVTHIAAVLARQAPGGRQTATAAPTCLATPVEWVEQVFALRRRRSAAAVFDYHFEATGRRRFQAQAGPTTGRCPLRRVAPQTPQRPAQLPRIPRGPS